jgi:hypothetical protein
MPDRSFFNVFIVCSWPYKTPVVNDKMMIGAIVFKAADITLQDNGYISFSKI